MFEYDHPFKTGAGFPPPTVNVEAWRQYVANIRQADSPRRKVYAELTDLADTAYVICYDGTLVGADPISGELEDAYRYVWICEDGTVCDDIWCNTLEGAFRLAAQQWAHDNVDGLKVTVGPDDDDVKAPQFLSREDAAGRLRFHADDYPVAPGWDPIALGA